ncbi:GNAT family N-acetyltransferase [Streptomyces genisteinicus]|uniref:GNAT family N-acetyltransferase n=1 Tax=Streptomyces genisteinicus TaxID=2768068 RepID=A0A7H0HP99_9ACTN|nr:GNAT family N-acetyltransferase [Streptomyces genisteinicus]QNP62365.1 GNAT family N-acetyltransferase [Streptomyces genisteinicus]
MTTTLRPTGPIRRDGQGARARTFDVCVNGRRVGAVELESSLAGGRPAGHIRSLGVDEPDRGRGRGTVAALAAEEVLRDWGCTEVRAAVPDGADRVLGWAAALGYTERGRNMLKETAEPPPPPPGVVARPMDDAEFTAWRVHAVRHFAQDWIDRGVPEDEAVLRSEEVHERLLPDGAATEGVRIHVLLAGGTPVGHVWVARHEVRPGEQGAYVFDVEVAEPHRGQGHGRALMQHAERIAHADGLPLIGLHVFAGNTTALGLYESLGYRTTFRNVAKRLL